MTPTSERSRVTLALVVGICSIFLFMCLVGPGTALLGISQSFQPCDVVEADVSEIRGIRDDMSSVCEALLVVDIASITSDSESASLRPTLTNDCKKLRSYVRHDKIDVCVTEGSNDSDDRTVVFEFTLKDNDEKGSRNLRDRTELRVYFLSGLIMTVFACVLLLASIFAFTMMHLIEKAERTRINTTDTIDTTDTTPITIQCDKKKNRRLGNEHGMYVR
jgi:hypothetical protein